ncbi:hypothetical protein AVEN_117681-1 [Araneus ventricosus]|uniref:Uncharacterized protein n=1 Tax=Araneus ventricosus TaxID=182803 RepID=A0A4Y2P490_ARAVE|nr:hypothetical protein AVEN_117681-1 [Araneus ventricosus]
MRNQKTPRDVNNEPRGDMRRSEDASNQWHNKAGAWESEDASKISGITKARGHEGIRRRLKIIGITRQGDMGFRRRLESVA